MTRSSEVNNAEAVWVRTLECKKRKNGSARTDGGQGGWKEQKVNGRRNDVPSSSVAIRTEKELVDHGGTASV